MTDAQVTALIAAVLMTSETHRYSTEEALRLANLLQFQAWKGLSDKVKDQEKR
jgi:hypothetical protein